MNRQVAALAVAACLIPSWLCAQSAFTITAASAEVHLGPSIATPVIGTARRGAVLEVTRELGSWVKVSWPTAKDGAGYVHTSTGSPSRGGAPERSAVVRGQSAPPASTTAERAGVVRTPPIVRQVFVAPTTHRIGLGGRIGGSSLGVGAATRAWRTDRLGLQLEVSRYAPASVSGADRMSSLQFEPSLLYALRDRVSDYWWLRPYVGTGPTFSRQTLNGTPQSGTTSSDLGYQAFGGGEMTFAALPRFALSAGVNYRWGRAPLAGVELGGMGFLLSGHWYVR